MPRHTRRRRARGLRVNVKQVGNSRPLRDAGNLPELQRIHDIFQMQRTAAAAYSLALILGVALVLLLLYGVILSLTPRYRA